MPFVKVYKKRPSHKCSSTPWTSASESKYCRNRDHTKMLMDMFAFIYMCRSTMTMNMLCNIQRRIGHNSCGRAARKHAGPPQTSMEQVAQVAYLTTELSYLLSMRCNVYIHWTCDPSQTTILPWMEILDLKNNMTSHLIYLSVFSASMCWNFETGHLIF